MLLQFMHDGGPLMWVLLACSVGLGAAVLNAAAHRLTARRDNADPNLVTPNVHPFFWEIPPQIGLLGTVLGLVSIFRGSLSPEAFGRGVSVACLTTVFGIAIALVARTAAFALERRTPASPHHATPTVAKPTTPPPTRHAPAHPAHARPPAFTP